MVKMKRKVLLFLLCLVIQILPAMATHRSLIIGVGNYPVESGWRQLSSCNDVTLLKGELSKHGKVSTLCDEQATYTGIRSALNKLLSETCMGDTVILHFSGHGQQMLTDDESESDMLDEAFVPYDAPSEWSKTYHGERHFRDNLMTKYLLKFRRKLHGNGLLFVVMDDCHSDSMHKGDKKSGVIYRGGAEIFGANTISDAELNNIRKKMKSVGTQRLAVGNDLSDVVMVSACKSYEKNREVVKGNIGYGSLSYAFAHALKQTGMKDIGKTLDMMYAQMCENVPFQSPQTTNTIGYQFKKAQGEIKQKVKPTIFKDTKTREKEINEGSNKLFFVLLATILSICIGLIWKIKKK